VARQGFSDAPIRQPLSATCQVYVILDHVVAPRASGAFRRGPARSRRYRRPCWPSPPDSRAGSQALPPRTSAAGERGAKRAAACPQARCRLLMSAPCPHGTEIRSGVGRVARRARLAAKPISRALPRLTLKAGHKAGLPTTALVACGALKHRLSRRSLLYLGNTPGCVCRDI
jgi:hypothetical protein